MQLNAKQVAVACLRDVRKDASGKPRGRDMQAKAKRVSKEVRDARCWAVPHELQVLAYWKQYDKVERENRKRAEKLAVERRKQEVG